MSHGADAPLQFIVREAATVAAQQVIATLHREPLVQPEWLSLQDAAIYTGYSEQQFSAFVKQGIAPKSVDLAKTPDVSSVPTLTLGVLRAGRTRISALNPKETATGDDAAAVRRRS